ncbi:hypothetical protein M3Y95_00168500 [Aphelenchoides besseyi]|nr:hypothetical protein M3Y95_00168500 [Aphelenchoides besseyi]
MDNQLPIQPLFPEMIFSTPKVVRGTGQLSWLSPKAGVIQCSNMNVSVSFQLKDFCDQGVTDFTSVLRPGFRLSFQAVMNESTNEWIGNYVAPISEPETLDEKELNLEEYDRKAGTQTASKDQYSLELEIKSLSFLLSIFQKNGSHNIALSSLHSRISNSGRDDFFRYIGSSSLKRRQFIERRSYVFHVSENDMVFLQPPEIYNTVLMLSSFLLRRGGVTSSDALFSFFNSFPQIPQSVKDAVQQSRHKFMDFLNEHPFAFAPFPSQFYVSVRRNLPFFEYSRFIKKNFPNCVYPIRYPGPNGIQQYSNFDQIGDQMGVSQFNTNGQINYPGMFQEDTPVVTPRNPWTNGDNTANTPYMPTQQVMTNATQQQMDYMNGGMTNNTPVAPLPQASVVPQPKLHPGVIGDRAMTRHNSVSSVGSNQYDMLRHSAASVLGDPRVSCSPPSNNLMATTSNGMRSLMVESSTQTEEGSWDLSRRIVGGTKECRCRCTCDMSSLMKIFDNSSI